MRLTPVGIAVALLLVVGAFMAGQEAGRVETFALFTEELLWRDLAVECAPGQYVFQPDPCPPGTG